MKKTVLFQHPLTTWAGIIGPALFVTVFTLEGLLRPGYNPLSTFVSALSLGPRGWTQMANFLIFGLLLFLFTRGIAAGFPSGKASRGGLILLTIISVCYFLSGPFVMDPTGTPLTQSTVHGTLHGIFGAIVFTLMPISIFVYLRRFRLESKWQPLQGWTIALGTLSALGVVLLTISTKFPSLQNAFLPWLGLIQRTAIVPFMLWLFLFALRRLWQDNHI